MKVYINSSFINRNSIDGIFLTSDDWDDWFMYQTKFYVAIHIHNESIPVGPVKIGVFDMPEENIKYEKTLDYLASSKNKNSLGKDFFSVGQNIEYYKTINKTLSQNEQKDFYYSMCDMVYDLDKYYLSIKKNVTITSLLRNVTKLQILKEFRRVVTGEPPLCKYKFKYYFPNSKDRDNLSFKINPQSKIITNMHGIIGRNGVGKTYIINNIISCFLQKIVYSDNKLKLKISRRENTNQSIGYIELKEDTNDDFYSNFTNIIHVSFSIFDGKDFEKNHMVEKNNEDLDLYYTYIGLNYNTLLDSFYKKLNDKKEKSDEACLALKKNFNVQKILIIKFYESLEICIKNSNKFKLLIKSLDIICNDPLFELSDIDKRIKEFNEVYNTKNNKDLNKDLNKKYSKLIETYNDLSSGHKVTLLSIVSIIAKIEVCSLILLDEPETHLHPPLLSMYLKTVSFLLKSMNAVGIIATHSPVVLQELPKQCIWIINRSGTTITKSRPEVETLGKSLDALTKEVFNFNVNDTSFVSFLKNMKREELQTFFDNNSDKFALEGKLIMLNLLRRELKNEKA